MPSTIDDRHPRSLPAARQRDQLTVARQGRTALDLFPVRPTSSAVHSARKLDSERPDDSRTVVVQRLAQESYSGASRASNLDAPNENPENPTIMSALLVEAIRHLSCIHDRLSRSVHLFPIGRPTRLVLLPRTSSTSSSSSSDLNLIVPTPPVSKDRPQPALQPQTPFPRPDDTICPRPS